MAASDRLNPSLAGISGLVLDVRRGACGEVPLPGSKSFSIRALLLAAWAQGHTRLKGLLDSDDTAVMIESLKRLGVRIEREGPDCLVWGADGLLSFSGTEKEPVECFVGNSGLTVRTLLPAVVAALSAQEGSLVLRGVPRMHERPIGDLVDGLRALGAQIDYLEADGFPPLRVRSAALLPADELAVVASTSSQFLTGLLQMAPVLGRAWNRTVRVRAQGELISRPYVDLSVALLRRFGVTVSEVRAGCFELEAAPARSGLLSPGELAIEGDASSASYFLAAGLLGGGPIRVLGAGAKSLQGDVHFADALEQMGARIRWGDDFMESSAARVGAHGLPVVRGVDLDCNHIPDAAMTLVAVALYAQGHTRLRNIGSWRVKETDRIAAMATEARKLGAQVEEGDDFIVIHPPARMQTASIQTYDDHRVAMSFSLASFVHAGDLSAAATSGPAGRVVEIRDPACVNKTFPDYFDCLADVCAQAVPVIAIDGPTASGKGTVAALVAQRLGFHYLDSGALYRLLALSSLRSGVSAQDERQLADVAAGLEMAFEGGRVLLCGEDVTESIRAEDVGNRASELAVWPSVRRSLLRRQRDCARLPGLVADGRDMGSVVFPHARTRIFLTASAEARAERRHKQLIEKGFSANLANLLADLQARDARDASRALAPLKFVEGSGAVLLDTTSLSIEEAVQRVLGAFERSCPPHHFAPEGA